MAEFIIVCAALCWSFLGLFVNALKPLGLSSVDISALRWIFASIVMTLIVLIKDRKSFKINLKDIWMFAVMGICSTFATSTLYFVSMSLTSVAVSDVLMYTSPIWVFIMSIVFLKEKGSIQKGLGVLVCFIGCIFVCNLIGNSGGSFSMLGIICGILSGITYGSYSIWGKFILRKYSDVTLTLYSFIFAGIVSLPCLNYSATYHTITTTPISIIYILGLAIISTVIPYFLYTTALKRTNTAKASVICCAEPVSSSIISVLILHEPMSIYQGLGIALIIVAIVIMQLSKDKTQTK